MWRSTLIWRSSRQPPGRASLSQPTPLEFPAISLQLGMPFMRYAVWNNKGGVGKTFLSFVLGTEIANERKIPVVLVDMCPQANLSEIVLGGNGIGSERLDSLIK